MIYCGSQVKLYTNLTSLLCCVEKSCLFERPRAQDIQVLSLHFKMNVTHSVTVAHDDDGDAE